MGIKTIEAKNFDLHGVKHGFFTRQGGVSVGIYKGLNCGPGSDDDPTAVQQNRQSVVEYINADHLLTLHQVHGKDCVVADAPYDKRPKADAHVTDVPGLALGILTADCVPVLFVGEKTDGAPVIGAAHAGWGGALKGVLAETVGQMQALGAELCSIRAAIGPCIAQKSYEVSASFVDPFMEEDEMNERFFMVAQREGHLMFDLPGYVALKLAKAGVKNVSIGDQDTYALEEDFFSYRRTTHAQELDYGRQISVVMIASS